MVVSLNRGTQYGPPYVNIRIIGTRKGSLDLGTHSLPRPALEFLGLMQGYPSCIKTSLNLYA